MPAPKKQNEHGTAPVPKRPSMHDYGVPKSKAGLLSWADVSSRLSESKYYWICTADPQGQPHATPVDGLWMDDLLYFGGSPRTRRNQNLVTNSKVSVHLESGLNAVILHGQAGEQPPIDRALAAQLADVHGTKYGYGFKAENFISGGPGLYIFRPHVAFAWSQFPKDATRWDFPA
jgi:hypothetical protein